MAKRDTLRARHEAKTAEQANDIAQTLSKTVLRFEVKAGPTGSLFGSVTPTDIADEIWSSEKIRVDVKTEVIPEGGELPSDEELAELEAAVRAEEEAAAPEPTVELEEILAEVDAAEAAEAETAEVEAAEGEADEAGTDAGTEPEWRADADAALAEE
jgi:hypothetical protein